MSTELRLILPRPFNLVGTGLWRNTKANITRDTMKSVQESRMDRRRKREFV